MQKRPKGWETAREDPNHVGELLITIDGTQYTGEDIVSCEVERNLLENTVEVGNATAAVLTLEINQKGTIAKRAKVVVQYRLVLDDAKTDYIPQGTYWINTREPSGRYLKLTCYDAMLMGQQNYLSDTTADDWPKQESDCAAEIAQRISVELDSRSSIGTGDNHMVSMPVGRTMRDVLQQIGAANGGNWCITPAGKLYLVPLAGTGDSLPEVSGAPDCGAAQSVTGVRVVRNSTDTPLLSGNETGTVLEVENENGTQDLADELAQKLKGLNYAPYTCDQRHIDPVAEAGDKITIGGTAYVAYNIKMTLGPSHYADLEAPAEAGELEEEYPYLSETKRTQKELETVTKRVSEIRKDQEKIETEVSETKKTVAETQEDIEAARKEAEEKSELAAKQAKEYTDGQLLNYSTTEETKSLIQQTKDSITSEVSKTYATTATVKKAQQDAQDYTDGQLIHYSTTEETKSLIQQTADSITSEVSKTYATTKMVEDAQQAATGEAKKYTDGKLVSYSTTEETKSLIKQSADSITSEVSKTYATTTVVEQAKKDATNAANGYTDGKLVSYTTKEETKSLIQQSADSITSEVSKTYATTTSVEQAKKDAASTANGYTDGKLKNYSTTEETKSLIKQSADSITAEVSKTYATTKTVEDAQQAATGEAKKYTDNKLKDYATNTSVSKIEQKADSITQTVNQRVTGGSNIIKGTDDWNNATLDAGGNDLSKKGTYTINGESVRVTNKAQNTRFRFGANTAMIIAKGVSYCASVLYKLNSGTNGLFLQFETKASDGTKTYYGTLFKQNQKDIDQGNGWYLRYAVFTATADGYADGLFVSTTDDFATITNDLTIMHPMVQMGNAPTGWTASTGDYMTATETKTEIKQELGTIKLTATTNGTSSTLTLAANGVNITSANISFTGVVTFNDLSTWNQDKTIINGGNITTGQIHNLKYSTVYDLDNAYIRMGTEAGERVYIDNRHIAWYATINTGSIGLTGVLYSEAGSSYIGACSKYAKYGWVDGLDPSTYVGMQVTYNRSDDSDTDFNTTRVGISGTLNCHNLSAWGSKSRVVNTSFGALKMAAFETPVPTFADWGRAECNADGWCLIVPDPRYAETVAQHGQLTWMLTDCDGTGHLWAEDCGQYAIVHGAAGQKFAWMCMAVQRGYEGEYAELSECNYPAPPPEGMELAASAAARALDAGAGAADDLLNTESAKTDDTLLEAEEQT
nr:MAG TPA: tail protein [Caudoviricetes sp.]